VNDLLREVGIKESVPINDIYRIGRQGHSYTMPMMVKIVRHIDKRMLMEKRSLLRAKKIFLNDDLTQLEQFNKKLLKTHLKAMKVKDPSIRGSIRRNSLHIKKDGYVINRFYVDQGIVCEASTRMSQ
jgi:hypothetical protein